MRKMSLKTAEIFERIAKHFLEQFKLIQEQYDYFSPKSNLVIKEGYQKRANNHLSAITNTLDSFGDEVSNACGGDLPMEYVKYQEYFCGWLGELIERNGDAGGFYAFDQLDEASKEYFSRASDMIFSYLENVKIVLLSKAPMNNSKELNQNDKCLMKSKIRRLSQ
jgi:hypothetical protein